jgi:hypothetical protein
MTDTLLDVSFLVLVYSSRTLWLSLIIAVFYIYTLGSKMFSLKRLLTLSLKQWRNRFNKNILEDKGTLVMFYNSCIGLEMISAAEMLSSNDLIFIQKLKRPLIFTCVTNCISKASFIVLKIVYVVVDIPCKNKIVAHSIWFSVLSIIATVLFAYYKLILMNRKKTIEKDNKGSKEFKT